MHNAVRRARATIEELKKLFATGMRPSGEDFAKLIDTLNDEIVDGTYYTRDEIDEIVGKLATAENLEEAFELLSDSLNDKAEEVHSHIEYVKTDICLYNDDILLMFGILKDINTFEDFINFKSIKK